MSNQVQMPYVVGTYKFKEPEGDNGYANQLQECADRNNFKLKWTTKTARDAAGTATTCMIPILNGEEYPAYKASNVKKCVAKNAAAEKVVFSGILSSIV
ncbi:hypothetical protein BDV93DRAFT_554489 [Ceratobasidium sp. AG-I]|nr:hypothetical protein BDV93DRAFT_554489 [Ceratobasidium sp. AG-I]